MSKFVNAQMDINLILKEELGVKNTGRFKMVCPNPAHRDSDGSFEVYGGDKGGYCFGCGKAYYPLDILMFARDITYYEALKIAESDYGAELPEKEDEVKSVNKADKNRYEKLIGIKVKNKKALHNLCIALNAVAEEDDSSFNRYCEMKGIKSE